MIMILATQAANNQINKISDLPDLQELVKAQKRFHSFFLNWPFW